MDDLPHFFMNCENVFFPDNRILFGVPTNGDTKSH